MTIEMVNLQAAARVVIVDLDEVATQLVQNSNLQNKFEIIRAHSLREAFEVCTSASVAACLLTTRWYDSNLAPDRIFASDMDCLSWQESGSPILVVTRDFSFERAVEFYSKTSIDILQIPENLDLLNSFENCRLPLSRKYRVAAGALAVEKMPHYLTTCLFQQGLISEHTRLQLNLAFQEALTNSLEHGNLGLISAWKEEIDDEGRDKFARQREERLAKPDYSGTTIMIEDSFDGKDLDIKITDAGQGFNIGSIGAVPASQIPVSCFGRGCSIILNTMDDVHFSMGGRCIHMKKTIL